MMPQREARPKQKKVARQVFLAAGRYDSVAALALFSRISSTSSIVLPSALEGSVLIGCRAFRVGGSVRVAIDQHSSSMQLSRTTCRSSFQADGRKPVTGIAWAYGAYPALEADSATGRTWLSTGATTIHCPTST